MLCFERISFTLLRVWMLEKDSRLCKSSTIFCVELLDTCKTVCIHRKREANLCWSVSLSTSSGISSTSVGLRLLSNAVPVSPSDCSPSFPTSSVLALAIDRKSLSVQFLWFRLLWELKVERVFVLKLHLRMGHGTVSRCFIWCPRWFQKPFSLQISLKSHNSHWNV